MAGAKKPGPLRENGGDSPWGGAGVSLDRPSIRPDFGARGGFDSETGLLWGIRLPWNQPGRPFFADAGELLDSLVARLENVADFDQLEELIKRILGPQSFALGVVYGAGEAFIVSLADLFGLIKTFVLADLYDATRRNPYSSMWQPGGVVRYLTAQALNEYFGEKLHEAARERDALIAEMKAIFESPGQFFDKLGEEYSKKFQRFVALSADSTLESQFQAGRIFGEILLEVVGLLAGGAAVVKGISKIPRLAKLGRLLKGKIKPRTKGAIGGEATVSGGPPSSAPRSASPPKEPKVIDSDSALEAPVAPAVVPKLPADMAGKVLYGTKNAKGKLIGAHSPEVLNRPDFKVKIEKVNPDGTMDAILQKQWPDGTWSAPKRSTLAPAGWSDTKIVEVTERIASSKPVGVPRVPGGETLHSSTVEGVAWVVIKDQAGAVTASYPSPSLPSGFGK